jgi:uncharacterized Zn finger protein
MTEYTEIQINSIDRAMSALEKVKHTLIKEGNEIEENNVVRMINELNKLQQRLEG